MIKPKFGFDNSNVNKNQQSDSSDINLPPELAEIFEKHRREKALGLAEKPIRESDMQGDVFPPFVEKIDAKTDFKKIINSADSFLDSFRNGIRDFYSVEQKNEVFNKYSKDLTLKFLNKLDLFDHLVQQIENNDLVSVEQFLADLQNLPGAEDLNLQDLNKTNFFNVLDDVLDSLGHQIQDLFESFSKTTLAVDFSRGQKMDLLYFKSVVRAESRAYDLYETQYKPLLATLNLAIDDSNQVTKNLNLRGGEKKKKKKKQQSNARGFGEKSLSQTSIYLRL